MENQARGSSSPATPALHYRPEIDGLRAVAVLAVVLFHARLGCPGGYIGVDVFFVISGFLITSLILRDIQGAGFRALDFWERRTRRIAPALIATVVAILVAGWFLLLPDDFGHLGSAVVAQTVLAANFYHWWVTGYFGPDAENLPLLHTWSLAVEEQFYLLLPMCLILLAAWRRSWLSRAIALVGVLSFTVGIWTTARYPSSAFYLLPTRAWELLLGSLLAAYPAWGGAAPRWAREAISLAGLGAIALAVVLFDPNTPFPGAAALLPCVGSAAFILANRPGATAGGQFLAWKPIVFIGQISYSFYLIHWPVLVFSFYWFREEITWEWKVALVAATFLLAVLSWVVVETPIRKKRVLPGRWPLFSVTAAAILLLLACGLIVRLNHGFPSRFDPRTLGYVAAREDPPIHQYQTDLRAVMKGDLTPIGAKQGPVRCLVWGDSHAMAMMPALDALGREKGFRGYEATYSSTAPVLHFVSRWKWALQESSVPFGDAVVKFAIEKRVQTVVLVAVWNTYARDPLFEQAFVGTVNTLSSAGLKVVIVRDIPDQVGDAPWLLARASILGRDVRTIGVPLEAHRNKNKTADAIFERLAGPNVIVLDPAPYFLDGAGLLRAERDGKTLYRDSQHLSVEGARRLKPLFEQVFRGQS